MCLAGKQPRSRDDLFIADCEIIFIPTGLHSERRFSFSGFFFNHMVTEGDKKYLSPSRKGDGGLSSCSPVSSCHILEAHCILSPLWQSRLVPSLPSGQKPNMTHLYRNKVCYSVDISDLPVSEVTRHLEEGKEVITSDTASETPRMCYAEGT